MSACNGNNNFELTYIAKNLYSLDTNFNKYTDGFIELDIPKSYRAVKVNENGEYEFTTLFLNNNSDISSEEEVAIDKFNNDVELIEYPLLLKLLIQQSSDDDNEITVADSWSTKTVDKNANSVYCSLQKQSDSVAINGYGISGSNLVDCLNNRKLIEVNEKITVFPIRNSLFTYSNKITNSNDELFITSFVNVKDNKFNGESVSIVSSLQGSIDPNTKFTAVLVRSSDEEMSCKPGDKTQLIIKGGLLLLVKDLAFEVVNSSIGSFYIFDYLKESLLLIQNNGKSITLQINCLKENNKEDEDSIKDKKSVSISKKVLIIICVVCILIIVIVIVVVVLIIRKKKNTSLKQEVEENKNIQEV